MHRELETIKISYPRFIYKGGDIVVSLPVYK